MNDQPKQEKVPFLKLHPQHFWGWFHTPAFTLSISGLYAWLLISLNSEVGKQSQKVLNAISVQPPGDLRREMKSTSSDSDSKGKPCAEPKSSVMSKDGKLQRNSARSPKRHLGLHSRNLKNGTRLDWTISPACSSAWCSTRKQITVIQNPAWNYERLISHGLDFICIFKPGPRNKFPIFLQQKIHLTFCSILVSGHLVLHSLVHQLWRLLHTYHRHTDKCSSGSPWNKTRTGLPQLEA